MNVSIVYDMETWRITSIICYLGNHIVLSFHRDTILHTLVDVKEIEYAMDAAQNK